MGLKGIVVMAVLACATACDRPTPGTAAQDGTSLGVVAETAIGSVSIPLFGKVQRLGEVLAITHGGANEVAWEQLPKALRILGIVVNVPKVAVADLRVWLWIGPSPKAGDWIDVTGAITPIAQSAGHRIAFRDISGEAILQHWSRGDAGAAPATLSMHRHDNGVGFDLAAHQAAVSPLAIGVGVPGSDVYVVRLAK